MPNGIRTELQIVLSQKKLLREKTFKKVKQKTVDKKYNTAIMYTCLQRYALKSLEQWFQTRYQCFKVEGDQHVQVLDWNSFLILKSSCRIVQTIKACHGFRPRRIESMLDIDYQFMCLFLPVFAILAFALQHLIDHHFARAIRVPLANIREIVFRPIRSLFFSTFHGSFSFLL